MAFEKIVLVTRKTRLEGLIARFNSKAQAKFVIERSGGDFAAYEREHDAYTRSLDVLRKSLELGLKLQVMSRRFVSTYFFDARDLIVTVGQDGLVANTAKYVGEQPIVAVNPDPERFDGVLLPFGVDEARRAVETVLSGGARERRVTLGEVELNDGQRLLAFNDFFIGAQSHVSARYRIAHAGRAETHSSSGVLVSTGAGSTGWLSSVFNMTSGISAFCGGPALAPIRLDWEDRMLLFVVREPYRSRHSQAELVAGTVDEGASLVLESRMPSGGVIFSDGVERDFMAFNSGATAEVRVARRAARLIVA